MNLNGIERLAHDLKILAADAEMLFSGEVMDLVQAREIRDRLADSLESVEDVLDNANDRIRAGARTADKVIRSRPYHAAGIALAVGVLFGVLMGRKK